MNKSSITILSIAFVLLLLTLIIGNSGKKPLDWTPSFNTKDKIPMGLYILDREIDTFFNVYVERYKDDLKDYFYEGVFEDSVLYDYALLNVNVSFDAGNDQINHLCRFVRNGNTVFLSAFTFPQVLMDSLKLEQISTPYSILPVHNSENITIFLTDRIIRDQGIDAERTITGSYFASFDPSMTSVLGMRSINKKTRPNFVQVRMGEGSFFIHLEPGVFTNYHFMRANDYKHTEKVLSYIPDHQDVVWLLHKQTARVISDSPLRFIMSQPALKWAWYLIIVGLLAFIIFNIRRSQRIIPIITAPSNSSVDFAKTIGNLYRLEGDMKVLIDKKIIYFLEKIRSEYHLSTDVLDGKFTVSLHTKSGKDMKIIQRLVLLINKHKQFDYTCTIHDLQRLSDTIENFYKS
ncbi:MAG: DUF4350 domain-containing protein [Saprospiraceae bacterium]|nr:DUF4350 domain-containing protein [Saprospiraceae bacterium]